MPDGLQPTTEPRPAASPGEDLARALADPAAAWPDVVLREHQLEALDELAGRLTHGATRTWVDAPTGSGKTIMFLALAQALGGSTLVLVPRRNLADQTFAGAGAPLPLDPDPPRGARRRRQARRRDLHLPGRAAPPGDHGLGVRDAPDLRRGPRHARRPDAQAARPGGQRGRRRLHRHRGHHHRPRGAGVRPRGRDARPRCRPSSAGILCPLRSLRVERAVNLSDVAKVRGDFDQASLGRALDRAMWHRACADVWVEHFQPLEPGRGRLHRHRRPGPRAGRGDDRSAGSSAAAVSGQTPARELQRVLFDFASSRIDVLCNADLLTEGWDETRAAVVMHLAPTTSERVFVQRLGRVMRPAPDKEAVSVEFLPAGDPMGVQTSHEVFGLGWYKPLGRVAGPPEGGERGKLAKAAALLARPARATRPSW